MNHLTEEIKRWNEESTPGGECYLLDDDGTPEFSGTEQEMWDMLLNHYHEIFLHGPYRERSEAAGGGWECHPEGVR